MRAIMTAAKWLGRASLPGLVVLAATAGAGSASASALSSDPLSYAAHSVVTSGGNITLPVGVLT
jgi:hypothetical protein